MKKIIILLCTLISLSVLIPSVAGAEEDSNTYMYEHKGVKISGNSPLSKDQIENIYYSSMKSNSYKNQSDIISPYSIPGGGNQGTITHGPVETETNPSLINFTSDLIAGYFMKRIPTKITRNVLFNTAANRFTEWLHIDTEPIAYWNWRVNEPHHYGVCTSDYQTLAMYTDYSYNNVTHIDYFKLNEQCE